MANLEHLEILKQGVENWNKWRSQNPELVQWDTTLGRTVLRGPDLRGAELDHAELAWANLSEANLSKAHLSLAKLSKANLSGANLTGAELAHADLYGSDLSDADLTEADLRQATLGVANLYGANLSRADLRGAKLGGAYLVKANVSGTRFSEAEAAGVIFANVDLSPAESLETVRNFGPCTIGIDTIYKSGGKIPEVFLRSCGLPDEFIAYIGSMVGRPIEFYSCFISYSTKDQPFADRLYADLQSKGVRCWFARR